MYAASALKALLGEVSNGAIPTDLMTTNRIMERWAVSNGNGLPTERWDDSRTSRPPALDDDTALVVDGIVLRCPPKTNKVIVSWFCKPLPTVEIARQLGMSRRGLEKSVNLSLNFLKWKFEASGHATLLRLLRVHV